MNIFKWLSKKYQSYRDRKFLKRLERVLSRNVVKSSLVVDGTLLASGSIYVFVPKETIDKYNDGKPINEIVCE